MRYMIQSQDQCGSQATWCNLWEKASHHTPIGKYNFDHRMANAKPRISREAENLYDQCHQTRLQSPLEGGTWVWVSIDLGQGARYRHSTCSQAEVRTSQVTSQGISRESRMLLRPRLTIQMFRANLLSLNLFRLSPQSPPRREPYLTKWNSYSV